MTASSDGRCPCGAVAFAIGGAPLLRLFCHCTICRAYNGAPHADVIAFRADAIDVADENAIAYRAWKRPPIVRRGTCRACDAPAIERARLPVLPDLVIVPTANLVDAGLAPAPTRHIYYASRVADVDDALPKHAGGMSSQLAFARDLVGGLRRARRG